MTKIERDKDKIEKNLSMQEGVLIASTAMDKHEELIDELKMLVYC